jgi:Domain of unknown function (DUF4190)
MSCVNYCTACGGSLEADARFCASCGAESVGATAPPVQTAGRAPRSRLATASLVLGIMSVWVFLAPLAVIVSVIALRRIRKRPELAGKGRAITGLALGTLWTILIPVIAVLVATAKSRPQWTVAPPGAPYRYTAPGDYSSTDPSGSGRYRSAITCNWFWTFFDGRCAADPVEVAVLPSPPVGKEFQPLLSRRLAATKPPNQRLSYAGTTGTAAGLAYRFIYHDGSGNLVGIPSGHTDYWIPLHDGTAIRVQCLTVDFSTLDSTCQLLLGTLHTTPTS